MENNFSTSATSQKSNTKKATPPVDQEQFSDKRPMSTTIAKPIEEVYAMIQRVENVPLFLENLEQVEVVNDSKSSWTFNNRTDQKLKVSMSSTTRASNYEILWKAEDAAGFEYSVQVFLKKAQSDRGTIVQMFVTYDTTTGKFAGALEKLFGKDAQVATKKTLQRFKTFCETGHVPTTEGQPSGRKEDLETTKH